MQSCENGAEGMKQECLLSCFIHGAECRRAKRAQNVARSESIQPETGLAITHCFSLCLTLGYGL